MWSLPAAFLLAVPAADKPAPPAGLDKLFGGKARHERAVQEAQQRFAAAHHGWQQQVAAAYHRLSQAQAQHTAAEQERLRRLTRVRAVYDQQCAERRLEVDRHNA